MQMGLFSRSGQIWTRPPEAMWRFAAVNNFGDIFSVAKKPIR
jgi:hypothetical protein